MVFTPLSTQQVLQAARQLCAEHPAEVAAAVDSATALVAARKIVADASLGDMRRPLGLTLAAATNRSAGEREGTALPAAQRTLRRSGPKSTLDSCPYCTEPGRRFCPESGRRHETADERSLRLWRTLYRQMQFHSRMANVARLDKPNTCAEEFFVEI
jgi:hypothetical protein